MATGNQIGFLKLNKAYIKEPILIAGSKLYEYDSEDIRSNLIKFGFNDITGIDISEGDGVDFTVDVTDTESDFVKSHLNYYNTVICMEILTNVKNPFKAAQSLTAVLKQGGTAILSECYVRKISKMPIDLWRFTYDGTKELFSQLTFDDSKAMISLTREKEERLFPLAYPLPQLLAGKHKDESNIGYLLRRLHRKFFGTGIFKVSRLFPETTIYSIAKKN